MTQITLEEILRDTAELARRAANKQGNIELAPETAERLDRIVRRTVETPEAESSKIETPKQEQSPQDCNTLAELADLVSTCTKCRLCEGRTQTVFADGNPNADIVFVGEAPGEQEDRQGIPFVGPAGQLLTDIIVKGMNLKRADVYICNVIKCRPPNNRDPELDEKAACEPYLVRQLELVKPKVICALGAHAAKSLLQTDESVGRLRKRWHFYRGIPLRVTYHPAYLLYSPSEKSKTWEDIQEVMKVLSGEVTPQP